MDYRISDWNLSQGACLEQDCSAGCISFRWIQYGHVRLIKLTVTFLSACSHGPLWHQ